MSAPVNNNSSQAGGQIDEIRSYRFNQEQRVVLENCQNVVIKTSTVAMKEILEPAYEEYAPCVPRQIREYVLDECADSVEETSQQYTEQSIDLLEKSVNGGYSLLQKIRNLFLKR